jgi:hypothetical protein
MDENKGKRIFLETYSQSSELPKYLLGQYSAQHEADNLRTKIRGIKPMP